eukprot:COSAG01_NODE_13965_length_1513_cov_5.898868_3_plen_85_part_00
MHQARRLNQAAVRRRFLLGSPRRWAQEGGAAVTGLLVTAADALPATPGHQTVVVVAAAVVWPAAVGRNSGPMCWVVGARVRGLC